MDKINQAVMVFCGLFSCPEERINDVFNSSRYSDFQDYFKNETGKGTLKRVFYPNFFSAIISSKLHEQNSNSCDCLFHHLIAKDLSGLVDLSLIDETGGSTEFSISRVDIFLFREIVSQPGKEKMGIYSIHVNLPEGAGDYRDISSFINRFRSFESANRTRIGEESFSTLEFIEKKILALPVSHEVVSNIMGNKLKTFTVINTEKKPGNIDELLFVIGTAQLHNSDTGEFSYSNSEELYREIMQSNTVSVYSNWKALSLFDSFTVIGESLPDISRTWCSTYLLIYIHCLKLKFYLFYVNSELAKSVNLARNTERLRTKFVEFISCNNFSSVSFNMLPNKLYLTIHRSLDIGNEVEELEKKITKMNQLIRERNEKRLNRIVLLLALLGAVSVIFHASEFLMKLFSLKEDSYPYLGFTISGTVIIIIAAYFLNLRNKSSHK